MRSTITITMSLALCMAMGCDDGRVNPDSGMGDAGPGDAGRDAGRDAGPTGDGNDTFASADMLTLGGAVTEGVITPARDVDYYSFEGTAGQWIQITTDANPDDDPTMIDTVVTLFDESMTQIAENDDAVPRANTDSEIITRLPSTGTYYILVQEFSTWMGEPPEGMTSYTYGLAIGEVNATASSVNIDAEGGDDVASAQVLREATAGGGAFSLILGDFDDATDVDVYSLTIPAGESRNYSVNMMPIGTDGYGAMAAPARMWIASEDGLQIIARVAPTADITLEPSLTPDADGTTFLLFVEHGTAVGDFYVLKAFRTADNPPETDDVMNNDITTPDVLTFGAAVEMTRSGFVLSHLGGDATAGFDTDHFRFTSMTGEAVSISCGSATLGSGVTGLTATILTNDGLTTVRMASETATTAIALADVPLPAAGDYILRLTKTGQDGEVIGDWVRCGVHLAPPTP